uniref:Putative secreted protein n=1 Tax=Ixodes ricinus TaxID=34613 RepID=A0A6B0URW5_IXORI
MPSPASGSLCCSSSSWAASSESPPATRRQRRTSSEHTPGNISHSVRNVSSSHSEDSSQMAMWLGFPASSSDWLTFLDRDADLLDDDLSSAEDGGLEGAHPLGCALLPGCLAGCFLTWPERRRTHDEIFASRMS